MIIYESDEEYELLNSIIDLGFDLETYVKNTDACADVTFTGNKVSTDENIRTSKLAFFIPIGDRDRCINLIEHAIDHFSKMGVGVAFSVYAEYAAANDDNDYYNKEKILAYLKDNDHEFACIEFIIMVYCIDDYAIKDFVRVCSEYIDTLK